MASHKHGISLFERLARRKAKAISKDYSQPSSPSHHLAALMDIPFVRTASVFLLFFLVLWCFILLRNSFHFCVISSDINCISGASTIPYKVSNESNSDMIIVPAVTQVIENEEEVVGDEVEKAHDADKVAQEQMKLLQSWRSDTRFRTKESCIDHGIFVYDLPEKFNKELLAQCKDLVPWANYCEFLANDAMGQPLLGLGKGWYNTHQYALEPLFHSRIMRHPCRVSNYESAKLFYVPYYARLENFRWNFRETNNSVKDKVGMELVQWLKAQPAWKKSSGKDHMFFIGSVSWDFRRHEEGGYGSNFLVLPEMTEAYKFSIERNPWDSKDIGIPYPTHFHPHNDAEISEWQSNVSKSKREFLISFAGSARLGDEGNVRNKLIEQCRNSSADCKMLECIKGACPSPEEAIRLFMKTDFCLQPRGDSATRKSFFDGLVAGCIPVVFTPHSAYYQYPWHLPADHQKYSVFIDEEEVKKGKVDVIQKLKKVSLKQKVKMRMYIIQEIMPGLVYGDSTAKFDKVRDAFDIVMDNMLSKAASL